MLLVTLGAMPLNGYIGYFLWPFEFHKDAFIGSALHLLIGLIPWLAGVILLATGSVKAWHLLAELILGIGGGVLLISCTVLNNAKDYKGALGWMAIFALGFVLAATLRATLEISRKTAHRMHC
jgi:hypothetical protein